MSRHLLQVRSRAVQSVLPGHQGDLPASMAAHPKLPGHILLYHMP